MSTRPEFTSEMAEPGTTDPASIARERFIHGLLETLHLDSPETHERRVRAALARIEQPHRFSFRIAWKVASIAAAAMVVVSLIVFSSHTSPSALAMVQASIKASRTAGDRRYDVRLIPIGQTEPADVPRCTIDIRDPDHFVIKARGVFHGPITIGRDEKGDWAIKREGTIDRFPPRRLLEEWMTFGPSTVMLVAVDDFLGSLEESYHLAKGERERVPFAGGAQGGRGGDSPLCDRITAQPKARTDGPERVEIWTDSRSHIVRRIEMHWPETGMPMVQIPGRRPPGGERPGPPAGRGPRPARDNPVPRIITFELIGAPALDASWFTPEAHGHE